MASSVTRQRNGGCRSRRRPSLAGTLPATDRLPLAGGDLAPLRYEKVAS